MDAIKNKLSGVKLIPLKVIEDDRGDIMHMLRSDSEHFLGFGEVYFSEISPNQIKAWKKNKIATQSLAVPFGQIRFVLFDDRKNSSTRGKLQVIELDRKQNYKLLQIPPNIWYGFCCIGDQTSLIANCSDTLHNPDNAKNLPVENSIISYRWEIS